MSTSAGRRSSPGGQGFVFHTYTGANPPPDTPTTAQSGTGRPGGAVWTPVWVWRGDRWVDKAPRYQNDFDRQCLICGRIFTGPHKGDHPDHLVASSGGYDRQHGREFADENIAILFRAKHPTASDAEIRRMVLSFRETHPYNDENVPE